MSSPSAALLPLGLGGSRASPEIQILVKSIQKQQGSMCSAAETPPCAQAGFFFPALSSAGQEGFSSPCCLLAYNF